MSTTRGPVWIAALLPIVSLGVPPSGADAKTEELGNGFFHHGVATPISNHRGTVATADEIGRDVVLVWLFDHRGGYALLEINAESGESREHPVPFPPGGDCPYSSLLSSGNKYYTHFNSYFVEFDPAEHAFTFYHETAPQMAMGMTEDDNGVVWSVTYPSCGVVSFDPATRRLTDYGPVYEQNWNVYPRHVAADDSDWIYFGVGNTATQIVAFDPRTGKGIPIIPEDERLRGMAYVYRDEDGKVYGHAGSEEVWYELHRGKAKKIPGRKEIRPKNIITGSQSLFHRDFPDGRRLVTCDLVTRTLVVEDPKTGETRRLTFDYSSEGAHIMGMAVAPNHTICGGTAFPMRFFSYDPAADELINRAGYGQWNTVARQGDRFYVGGYPGGFLLEWNPFAPWVPTEKGKVDSNPLYLTECAPDIYRPHDLLALPDGKTLVLAGTPGYGYTGGGLLFWNRETGDRVLLTHRQILPDHSTLSLTVLPDGNLLGGSTTSPGTGGEKKARQAELFIMNPETRRVVWHQPVLPGTQGFTDLCPAPDGLVYGVADRKTFFVFDPITKKIVYRSDVTSVIGPTISHQGPRIFVPGAGGALFMLFANGIGKVEHETHEIIPLAESPVSITCGGDYLNGRIYFGGGSHLYSFQVPACEEVRRSARPGKRLSR